MQRRYPALRHLGFLWRLVKLFDLGRGYWELVPWPVRHMLTVALLSAIPGFPLGRLLIWGINSIAAVNISADWIVIIPVSVGFGFGLWGTWVVTQAHRAAKEQNRAYEVAITGGGNAMNHDARDAADAPAVDEQVTGTELGRSQPPKSGYVNRFGMLWHLNHIPRPQTVLETLSSGITGMLSRPMMLHVEGPFCPNDYERLRLKDNYGYRHMSDGDDVNWVGSPYCPKCGFNERPDPNYRAARLLGNYRQMVKAEFDYHTD